MLRKKQLLNLIIIIITFTGCAGQEEYSIECYTVKRGDLIISVTETGELEAVNSQMITGPLVSWQSISMLKILKIVEDGKQVEKGDFLIEYDKTDVEKAIKSAKASLEIAQAELRITEANQKSQLEELETKLKVTELSHQIIELNLQVSEHMAEVEKTKIELELEKSNISLERARQEIENRREINNKELNSIKLKVRQTESNLEEGNKTLEMLAIYSPGPGIAIIAKNKGTEQKFKVNDQTWPRVGVMGLPDLSQMKTNVLINEVDIAKIDLDQPVIIKLDAFPDKSFHGVVSDIATLARVTSRDSKVKVFDVQILVDKNVAEMMPGMTVSCEIIADKITDTVYIPLEALFRKNGKNIVYIKKGSEFISQEVTPGLSNDNYVIINEGIREGDLVALLDPFDK